MNEGPTRALCPRCSADILRPGPNCWLCHSPLPAEMVEQALVAEALRAPMTVRGSQDLESANYGLLFLFACLIAGGFTLSPKFGGLFLVLLSPAVIWLLVDHAPAKDPKQRPSDSTALAWTIAALILLPISVVLALASTGLVAFNATAMLGVFR